MSKVVTLYGYDCTRPGVEPKEWYGVIEWHTNRHEAVNSAARAITMARRFGGDSQFVIREQRFRMEPSP